MKRVLFSRHAKSDWGCASLDDHDRPLNPRGKKDAPAMGQRLAERELGIQRVLTSSALRAEQTAIIVSKELGFTSSDIHIEPHLYLASVKDMLTVLSKLPTDLHTVALFAHNPGMTDAANALSDLQVGNVPTCGMFMIEFACEHWDALSPKTATSLFYDYPKLSA